MIAGGVLAGANIPCGETDSNPGTLEAIVGTPGSNGLGSSEPTPSALILPCFTYDVPEAPGNMICASPVMRPISAGPEPLYGTRTHLTPVNDWKSSAARCGEAP